MTASLVVNFCRLQARVMSFGPDLSTLPAGGRSSVLPPADPLHARQHPAGGLAAPLHGGRHPGRGGAPRTPDRQARIRQPPAAADPGAQKDLRRGAAGQPGWRLRAGAPVHARPRRRPQPQTHPGSANGGLDVIAR